MSTKVVGALPYPAPVRPLATTYIYYAVFIGLGLISSSLGPTLPGLAAQTQTDLRAISFLFAARSTGYLLGSLLGGRLYDRVTGHRVMGPALLLMGIGMFLVPTLPILWVLALVLLLIGVGEGTVDVGGNTLLVWVHRGKVGPFMNGLHFFFGLGAFIAPIVIAWAMSAGGGIRWGYWLLGLYVVPIVIWLMRMPSPVHAEASAAATALRPVNWRLTGLIMLLMLLYVGAEVGVAGWLYTYAVTLDLASTTSAAYLTSVFWGALTAGRLLAIPIAARFRPRTILLVDLLGSIGSVALMVFVQDRAWALWVGALSVGLFMASIFPTVIVWAERRMRMSGTVTSMFLVGASLGAMFVPWLIGQMFEARGPGITMVAVLVTLILALGVFLVVMANGGTPHPELNEEV